eukprot:13853630-Alexandrium_andersonii.AAC.1
MRLRACVPLCACASTCVRQVCKCACGAVRCGARYGRFSLASLLVGCAGPGVARRLSPLRDEANHRSIAACMR